jgi:hypothetical protein
VAPAAALDAVAAALQGQGIAVRRVSPQRLEFESPARRVALPGSLEGFAAIVITGGAVTLDPVHPRRFMHLELRYSPVVVLLLVLAACFVVAGWDGIVERAVGLSGLVTAGFVNWWWARDTVEGWIADAAHGLPPARPPRPKFFP